MSNTAIQEKPRLTWSDYVALDDGLRWELIGGELKAMSPSPTPRHQMIQHEMASQMRRALKGKRCVALGAPLDVKLSDDTVVQPDILVVCRKNQIKETHIEGAPYLVVEILSESSFHRDRLVKLSLYARHGVREYWIVTPFPPLLEQFVLDGSTYRLVRSASQGDRMASITIPEIEVDLDLVFDFDFTEEDRLFFKAEEPWVEYGVETGGTGFVPPSDKFRNHEHGILSDAHG